jgi:hypothetical protein
MSVEPKRYCWNADNWVDTLEDEDREELTEDMQPGDVMRIGRAVELPDVWVTPGPDGDPREFPTQTEAEAYAKEARAAWLAIADADY